MARRVAIARAYGSSANLGPGFDTVAVALEVFYDTVEVELEYGEKSVQISRIEGPFSTSISLGQNTATIAVEKLLDILGVEDVSVSIKIYKGVPPGKGLGSSGASAVAAVLATTSALGVDIDYRILLEASGYGEIASAGQPHYDNVAASLLGGLVVVAETLEGVKAQSIELDAWFVVIVPDTSTPPAKTHTMRRILPESIKLASATSYWQKLGLMVLALAKQNYKLAGRLMTGDKLIEPLRAQYTPCYYEVKKTVLEAGAYGVALSGAGPSLIALVENSRQGRYVAREVEKTYRECGVPVTTTITRVGGPARVIDSY